jgi:hypothetical protein
MKDILKFLKRAANPKKRDGIQLYGHFELSAYDTSGGTKRRVHHYSNHNQVTNDGRRIVLELLRQTALTVPQANPNYNQLWSLGVGTNATPAAVTDAALYAPVWNDRFNSDAEIYLQALPQLEIVVAKSIPEVDAVGFILCEAGLFCRGDRDDPTTLIPPTWETIPWRRMYARQTFTPVTKTITMLISFDWRLGVTVAGGP